MEHDKQLELDRIMALLNYDGPYEVMQRLISAGFIDTPEYEYVRDIYRYMNDLD